LDDLGIPEAKDGQLRPTLDKIELAFANNFSYFKKKIEQGFTRLLIVPFGLPIEELRRKYADRLVVHNLAGRLFAEGDSTIPLGLNEIDPVYKWIGYDVQPMVYFPKKFDPYHHKGLTKDQVVAKYGFWQVYLIQNLSVLEKNKEVLAFNGRQPLKRGLKPIEYLQKIHTESQYEDEVGLTPEIWLMKALASLEEKNQVIDDCQGYGILSYNLAAYFPNSDRLSSTYWSRDNMRAYLVRSGGWDDSSQFGAYSAVRVGPTLE
jgi:hypothetical protein